ncbi:MULTISPECIES: HTH domain-containing protein [unclassified Streptomyces]|uniref:HTH domain-containing protein n=1 Tax=unclassified Streptomyces TaxID=2593676 RepID=UPI000C2748B5|nr:HTH domain-containing protein [Streptomyces sp. CB01373]PJM91831.1 hypothetical protein CG719_32025 [Streptomyces sp. CB01373]
MLQRTLAEPGSDLVFVRPLPDQSETDHAEAQLCFEIRRDAAGRGLTIRTLAQRHNVSRRTVRRALSAVDPPAHALTHRRTTAVVDPLQALIDPMLEEGMIAKGIWISLVDEYAVTVSMSTLVRYAAKWRLDRDRHGQTRPVYFPRDSRREA